MGLFFLLPPFIPKRLGWLLTSILAKLKGPMATLGIITRPCFEVALASLKLEESVTRSCVPCSPRLCGSAYPFLSNTHKPHNQDSIPLYTYTHFTRFINNRVKNPFTELHIVCISCSTMYHCFVKSSAL